MVNDVPVPRDAPPVAAAYQLMVPAEAVAPRVTVPVPQVDPGVRGDSRDGIYSCSDSCPCCCCTAKISGIYIICCC